MGVAAGPVGPRNLLFVSTSLLDQGIGKAFSIQGVVKLGDLFLNPVDTLLDQAGQLVLGLTGFEVSAHLEEMAASGKPPRQIVEEKGLAQISDAAAIEKVVSEVLTRCSAEVAAYQKGKTKMLGFFVGQVMQATRGRADPKHVNEILKRKLAK